MGKLYETYYTHALQENAGKFARLRRIIRNAILGTNMDYAGLANGFVQKVLGTVLSCVGPIREMAEVSVMTLKGSTKGRLLDVGCANGQFLATMRDLGWEVVGVEPDRQAAEMAREHLKLKVYKGVLEEAGFSNDSFDAITMNHVIEHVWEPIGTLRECHRVLKPAGRLVVVTPNIESLGHRLFTEAWLGIDPPRHLYVFSPRSLRACAEQADLTVIQLGTTSRTGRGVWVASRLIRRDGVLPGGSPQNIGLPLRLEGLAFQVAEYGLCRVKEVGEEIVLFATK